MTVRTRRGVGNFEVFSRRKAGWILVMVGKDKDAKRCCPVVEYLPHLRPLPTTSKSQRFASVRPEVRETCEVDEILISLSVQ